MLVELYLPYSMRDSLEQATQTAKHLQFISKHHSYF